MTEFRILRPEEAGLLKQVAPGVFDRAVREDLSQEFLADPRHHLAVALDDGRIVGIASAVHYVHPDKPPELWINEVAVAEGNRNQGIGRGLMGALFDHGRRLGCAEAWVLAEGDNTKANQFYVALGGEATPSVMYSFKL